MLIIHLHTNLTCLVSLFLELPPSSRKLWKCHNDPHVFALRAT
jgi:hypothetical protein